MKKLVLLSIPLAMVVIMLGAYTRLTDAGLGCPDWPGCYGHYAVPQADHHVAAANEAYPDRPVEAHKAWNEMIHRYFAGALGLCILAISILTVVRREPSQPRKLPLFLLGLVIFQAALGMWTVTLNLLPVVVMGHLLGGFSVLCCLFLLYLRLDRNQQPVAAPSSRLLTFSLVGIGILICQIALGGWTSANYSALACTQLPVCEGDWWANLDMAGAYSVPDAHNYEYGAHDYTERMTMHIAHRFGALITFVYLCWLGIALYRRARINTLKVAAVALLIALSAQVLLGVGNVVLSLPLAVAVAHNAVAACLLLLMVWITYFLYRHQGGAHG